MKLIQENTFEKSRKEINKFKEDQVVFSSDDDELNRKVMEKIKIDVLLINLAERKDYQKQRNSGLNQVLARIAKKAEICIGINLDEIIEANKFNKAQILARLEQNIKLCNKNKLKMIFTVKKKDNMRNIYDLKSLGLVLGMPTWMTKNLVIQSFFN